MARKRTPRSKTEQAAPDTQTDSATESDEKNISETEQDTPATDASPASSPRVAHPHFTHNIWLIITLAVLLIAGALLYHYRFDLEALVSPQSETMASTPIINSVPAAPPVPATTATSNTQNNDATLAAIQALEARLEQFETTLQNATTPPASSTPANADSETIDETLAQLITRVENLEIPPAEAEQTAQDEPAMVPADELEALRERMQAEQEAMLQRLHQLEITEQLAVAVEKGEPYHYLLSSLQEPELAKPYAVLNRHAYDGVPTIASLQTDFNNAVSTYYREAPPSDKGWLARIRHTLSSLVQVRKVGATHLGADAGSVIARAEDYAQQGHLAKALNSLQEHPEVAAHFANWSEQASMHLRARKAVATMKATLLNVQNTQGGA